MAYLVQLCTALTVLACIAWCDEDGTESLPAKRGWFSVAKGLGSGHKKGGRPWSMSGKQAWNMLGKRATKRGFGLPAGLERLRYGRSVSIEPLRFGRSDLPSHDSGLMPLRFGRAGKSMGLLPLRYGRASLLPLRYGRSRPEQGYYEQFNNGIPFGKRSGVTDLEAHEEQKKIVPLRFGKRAGGLLTDKAAQKMLVSARLRFGKRNGPLTLPNESDAPPVPLRFG